MDQREGDASDPAAGRSGQGEGGDRAENPRAGEAPRAGRAGEEADRRGAEADTGLTDRSETTEGQIALTPREQVLARALAKARYHEDREAFLGGLTRSLNFGVLLSGTLAIASLTGAAENGQPKWIAAATAIIGGMNLVFDLAGRMRTHAALRKQATEIVADAMKESADVEALNGRLVRIAVDAPPTYHALEALAYNAAQEALGRDGDDKLLVVPAHHVLLRNFWRFRGGYRTADEMRKLAANG